jgi:hypothetical protein
VSPPPHLRREIDPVLKMLGYLEFVIVNKVTKPSSPESFMTMANRSIAPTFQIVFML